MSTTVVEFENQDVIVVEMSGRGPIGPRGRQGEPGPAGPSEWGVIQGNISDQTDLQNALDAKADAGTSYTKSEDDALLAQKADADSVYTKTETDSLLADKADSDTVYTKTETDTLLGAKADVGDSYTKTEEDALLAVKANSADVYTKTETDTLLADKADADDVYTKAEVDDALADKADSADVYTKDETDEMLLAKAPVILSSASGSIASFTDGSASPVTALSVGIEPVQDLHGYDNPWPAGGGKNLLKPPSSGATINGVTFTVNSDGTITANGTATANADFYFVGGNGSYADAGLASGQYILTGQNASGGAFFVVDSDGNTYSQSTTPSTITFDSTKTYRIFIRVNSGTTRSNYKYYPMIRLASVTDATFTPYSNICPISGHTSAVVTRTGKNLCEGVVEHALGLTNNNTQLMLMSNAGTCLKIHCKSGVTYTVSGCPDMNRYMAGIFDSDPNIYDVGTRETITSSTATSFTFTASKTGICLAYVANSVIDTSTAIIELGSSASAYEAPQIQTVTIDLNGTRYGGELNLLTGTMTVDRKFVSFNGTETWTQTDISSASTALGLIRLWTGLSQYAKKGGWTLCNQLETYSGSSWAVNKQCSLLTEMRTRYEVAVYTSNYADATAWKAHLAQAPLQAVYYLETPLTVQLTPSQLSTLLGQNHIFADTGDVAVEYRADTKLYIDGKFSQLQALILEN